jgi:hypothetical protein
LSIERSLGCGGVEGEAVEMPLSGVDEGFDESVGVENTLFFGRVVRVEVDDEGAGGFEALCGFEMGWSVRQVGEELGADSAFEEFLKDSGGIALKPYREG